MNGTPDTDAAKTSSNGKSGASASMPSGADDEPFWMPHLLENYERSCRSAVKSCRRRKSI